MLFSLLITSVLATFLWVAYYRVAGALVRAGSEQARAAADQLAVLVAPAARQRQSDMHRAAVDSALRDYLRNPTEASRVAAETCLRSLISTGQQVIELWNDRADRVLAIPFPPAALDVLRPGPAPSAAGVRLSETAQHAVVAEVSEDIFDEVPNPPSTAGAHLGYVIVRRPVSASSTPDVLNHLVGVGAQVELGGGTSSPWTDLSGLVSAPPIDLTRPGEAEYRDARGERHIGSLVVIRGTPWSVWVEFPWSVLVLPARAFLREMGVVALGFVMLSAVLSRIATARITRPLTVLTHASEAIAAGDLAQRVSDDRPDEIGRLGGAFNSMVARIRDAQGRLEAQVRERTVALDALRQSETHYRAIVEVALDAIITMDAGGRITEFNPAAERIFGYARSDVLGQDLADLIIPEGQRDVHRRGLAHRVSTGQGPLVGRRIELTALRSGGQEFPVEIAIQAFRVNDEPRFTAHLRDITERRQILGERQAAEADALERARRAAFVADVALTLTEGESVPDMLGRCAKAMVHHLDAALARIWTLSAAQPLLELQASAGLSGHLDAEQRQVPLGHSKIGRIGADQRPYLTNTVVGDPLIPDQAWVTREHLVSFAGYPLVLNQRLVGVMAMFAREPLSDRALESLALVAHAVALGIERKQLEESQRRLADILQATPDFVTIGTPDGAPVYVNRAARAALGIGSDEHVKSLLQFRPPEFGARLTGDILPHAVRDGSWSGETEYLSRSGRVIPVSQVSVVDRSASGEIEFVSTISRDISQQKAADATLLNMTHALMEADERMRFALEASKVGIWEANLRTQSSYWSETCETMHGVEPGMFGKTMDAFIDRIHPDDRQQVRQRIEQAARAQTDAKLEYRTVWPDGRIRWIESTGRISCDDTGAPVRAAGVAIDVTERRSLEDQLRQAQKIEAIGQLAGGLAHDFNNLLTVILGYGRLLEEALDPGDPRQADVKEVLKAGERASHLTRQLLAFSRKQILQPTVLDLNALVEDMRGLLDRLVGENIDLQFMLRPDLGRVKADPGQMEQILVNLSVNARDAMAHGGALTIETANVDLDERFGLDHLGVGAGAYVMLAIGDSGIGMDKATTTRIYEPFFTTKGPGKGTGLGLATVFGIVKQHNGSIWVYSEPGHGTTFKIYLPRVEGDVATLPTPPLPDNAAAGSETILVVEDEAAVRALVQAVLQRSGYTVVVADPQDAIRMASEPDQRIDLLLTDVIMPGLSGPDLLVRLRQARPGLRVLYMSGFADDAISRHGVLELGTPFLQKPFTGAGLVRKVRETLD